MVLFEVALPEGFLISQEDSLGKGVLLPGNPEADKLAPKVFLPGFISNSNPKHL